VIKLLSKSYVCDPSTLLIKIQENLIEKSISVQLFYGKAPAICIGYSSGLSCDHDPEYYLLSYLFVLVSSDEDMLLSLIDDGQWAATMYARAVIRSVYKRSGVLVWKRGG
jgi:hypothetical protein